MAVVTSSEITSRAPLADLVPEKTQPPSYVYIGRNDRLYLHSVSLVSTRSGQINGRLLRADGEITPFRIDVTIPAGTPSVQVFDLAEGYLVSITFRPTQADSVSGLTVAELGILRGRAADFHRSFLLTQGKPSIASPIGWPYGKQENATDGNGWLRQQAATDPGAGVEWSITLAANVRSFLRSVRFRFVTDATVANRFPRVEYVVGAVVLWRSHPNDAQTASQTRDYNFALGTDFITAPVANEYQNQLPKLPLENGSIIRSSTDGIVAGDDFSAIETVQELWLSE